MVLQYVGARLGRRLNQLSGPAHRLDCRQRDMYDAFDEVRSDLNRPAFGSYTFPSASARSLMAVGRSVQV